MGVAVPLPVSQDAFSVDIELSSLSGAGNLADVDGIFVGIDRFGPGTVFAVDSIQLVPLLNPLLQAGDANEDFSFDEADLVQVQQAGKYLTGEPATWGEGDWNGAPGGSPGNPPVGDGTFNQLDIVAAQQAAIYLTGAYAVVGPNGQANDSQTSIVYNVGTGELAVDAPAGTELTSW